MKLIPKYQTPWGKMPLVLNDKGREDWAVEHATELPEVVVSAPKPLTEFQLRDKANGIRLGRVEDDSDNAYRDWQTNFHEGNEATKKFGEWGGGLATGLAGAATMTNPASMYGYAAMGLGALPGNLDKIKQDIKDRKYLGAAADGILTGVELLPSLLLAGKGLPYLNRAITNIGGNIGKYAIGPDGKIFNSKIIQRPDYFYRTVGMDAIEDANATGVIRGNPATGDGPYFQTDVNPQRRLLRASINNVNKGKSAKRAVIEGRPESAEAWVDSWRASSRKKYIEDQVKLAANFGDDSEFEFWHELYSLPIKDIRNPIIENKEALPYLNRIKQTLLEFGTEAFPMTLGKFEAPSSNFTYYKEFPLIGWRQFKFKKIPR